MEEKWSFHSVEIPLAPESMCFFPAHSTCYKLCHTCNYPSDSAEGVDLLLLYFWRSHWSTATSLIPCSKKLHTSLTSGVGPAQVQYVSTSVRVCCQGILLAPSCKLMSTERGRIRWWKYTSIVTNSLLVEGKGLVGMGLGKMEWLQMEMVVVVMTDLQLALPGSTGIVNKDISICQSWIYMSRQPQI